LQQKKIKNKKPAVSIRRIPIVSKSDPSVPERLSLKLDTYFLFFEREKKSILVLASFRAKRAQARLVCRIAVHIARGFPNNY
jgi:hypothetical protein